MALIDGLAGSLFHVNFKINTEQRGYNLKFHLVGSNYDAVSPMALRLANQLRGVLPTDATIFYATVTNDNTTRDSIFLRGALGDGLFGQTGGPPLPAKPFDNSRSAILLRLEGNNGQSVPIKINPVPDEVMTDGTIVTAIDDVVGMPVAFPAVASPTDTFKVAFNKLMQEIVFSTRYVKSGHPPGGAFQYDNWKNAYVLRQSVKRGGRVFNS